MDEENARVDGVLAAGELSVLLQRAVDLHMYGNLVLIDDDETVLTFVDGQLVVRPGPESRNPKAGQAALARRLRRLIGDDGYVGPFRGEPVLGEPGLHALHRFDPTEVLEAAATATKKGGASTASATGSRTVRSSQLRGLLLGGAPSPDGSAEDETNQVDEPDGNGALSDSASSDSASSDSASSDSASSDRASSDSASSDSAPSEPAKPSAAKGLSALERVVRELGS